MGENAWEVSANGHGIYFEIVERIADGFYMIKSIQLLEYILDNPKLLEDDCNAKVEIK